MDSAIEGVRQKPIGTELIGQQITTIAAEENNLARGRTNHEYVGLPSLDEELDLSCCYQ